MPGSGISLRCVMEFTRGPHQNQTFVTRASAREPVTLADVSRHAQFASLDAAHRLHLRQREVVTDAGGS